MNIVEWYHGTIVNYDAVEKEHKMDNEEDFCSFDLVLDLLSGDLEVQTG